MCNTQQRPIRQIMRPNGLMVIRALQSALLVMPLSTGIDHPFPSCPLCSRFALLADTYGSLIKRETPHAFPLVSVARARERERSMNAERAECKSVLARVEPSNGGVAFAYRNLEGTNFS